MHICHLCYIIAIFGKIVYSPNSNGLFYSVF